MTVGSKVNPNFPIPGIDQSSKGFRDNFAIIKKELEGLQGTTIQLSGAVLSDAFQIGNSGSVVIHTEISGGDIYINPPNYAIQYNDTGSLKGDQRLIFDPVQCAVGIGTTTISSGYTLDISGLIKAQKEISILDAGTGAAKLIYSTSNVEGIFSSVETLNNNLVVMGSTTSTAVNIISNDITRILITPNGLVGIGTTLPVSAMHIVGDTSDVALVETKVVNNDSMVRARTYELNSTIAWGLEHRSGNYVGGMRLSSSGLLSFHTGENADADLSTSSIRLAIDKDGNIGIGTLTPQYDLHVDGSFKSMGITDTSDQTAIYIKNGGFVGINKANPSYQFDVAGAVSIDDALVFSYTGNSIIDTSPVLIDTWSMVDIRSARYNIQVTRGNSPSEQVNLTDYLVVQVNGTVVPTTVYFFTSSGNTLGTLSVQIVDDNVDVFYTGNDVGNVVRLSKVYIAK